jgi:hypothetical protein
VARYDYMIIFHKTNCTISKDGKIIVHTTKLREMYHIVSSGSLAESKKVKSFACYILSNIEFKHHHLEYAE